MSENQLDNSENNIYGNNQMPVPKKHLWGNRQLWLVITLALLLIGGGVYLNNRHKGSSSNTTGPYFYTYKTLKDDSLQGPKHGEGLAFKRMAELTPVGVTTPIHKSYVQLAKKIGAENSYTDISTLSATAYGFPTTIHSTYFKAINNIFKDGPKNADYKSVIKPVQQFAQSSFKEQTIKVDLGTAKSFTNPNIKTNAWQFDVMTIDQNQSQKAATPTQKGTMLFAFGSGAYYYFIVTAEQSNWQNNQAVFQQVLDSIKIDQ